MGWPSGLTTRPSRASPTGTCRTLHGALDHVALLDAGVVAQDDDADVVALEVHGHAVDVVREEHHLLGHDAGQAVDVGDAVAGFQNVADFFGAELDGELLRRRIERVRNGRGVYLNRRHDSFKRR